MTPDLFTVDEVAAMFDCSTETVELEAREKRLPGLKIGRSWRFPREALLQVINARALAAMADDTPPPGVTPIDSRRGRRQPVPQLPAAARRAAKS